VAKGKEKAVITIPSRAGPSVVQNQAQVLTEVPEAREDKKDGEDHDEDMEEAEDNENDEMEDEELGDEDDEDDVGDEEDIVERAMVDDSELPRVKQGTARTDPMEEDD
jgi:segregation and condensation protein B